MEVGDGLMTWREVLGFLACCVIFYVLCRVQFLFAVAFVCMAISLTLFAWIYGLIHVRTTRRGWYRR